MMTLLKLKSMVSKNCFIKAALKNLLSDHEDKDDNDPNGTEDRKSAENQDSNLLLNSAASNLKHPFNGKWVF